MTEDDTFGALQREDFHSVYSRYLRASDYTPISDEDLKGTGWTLVEFQIAFNKWLISNASQDE